MSDSISFSQVFPWLRIEKTKNLFGLMFICKIGHSWLMDENSMCFQYHLTLSVRFVFPRFLQLDVHDL